MYPLMNDLFLKSFRNIAICLSTDAKLRERWGGIKSHYGHYEIPSHARGVNTLFQKSISSIESLMSSSAILVHLYAIRNITLCILNVLWDKFLLPFLNSTC